MNSREMLALLREVGATTRQTSPFHETYRVEWQGVPIHGLTCELGRLRLTDDCSLQPDPMLWDVRRENSPDGEDGPRRITPKSGCARAAVRLLIGLLDEVRKEHSLPKFQIIREDYEYVFLEKLSDASDLGYKLVGYRSWGETYETREALLEWQGEALE